MIARWLDSPGNILFLQSVLSSKSLILELGCGISGLLGLVLLPKIGRFIATDQSYIGKILQRNLKENAVATNSIKPCKPGHESSAKGNVDFLPLDWELDSISSLVNILDEETIGTFDALIACDCIYNESLVNPFVQTCAELCRLRTSKKGCPTVCLVAQQLRSPEIFEQWLSTFRRSFRVWRFSDEFLPNDLRSNSGFVLHLGVPKISSTEHLVAGRTL